MTPGSSKNTAHGTLIRVVEEVGQAPDTTWIQSGVTRFNIRYYDDHGRALDQNIPTPISSSQFENIKQLYIELEVQSDERIPGRFNSNARFIRSVWEKRFSPRNLEIEL
jgi:hypothetical protein